MPVSSFVKFTQAATTDAAGRALIGASGVSVDITNGVDTGVDFWEFELLDVPPGSTLIVGIKSSGASPTVAFTPDIPGCYRWRMAVKNTVLDEIDTDIRNFAVPNSRGWIIPPYQKLPDPIDLGLKPDELNFTGQSRGWSGDNIVGLLTFILNDILSSGFTGGGSGYATIEDEGVAQPQRVTMNFIGAGVTVSDTGTETNITIPGGGAGLTPPADPADDNRLAVAFGGDLVYRPLQFDGTSLTLESTVANPVITHADIAAPATSLTIQSQTSTAGDGGNFFLTAGGGTLDGGDVTLTGGTGPTTGGSIFLQTGTSAGGTAGSVLVNTGSAGGGTDGTIDLQIDSTSILLVDSTGATVTGKLTVSGSIDPIDIIFTGVGVAPNTAAGEGAVFVDTADNRLKYRFESNGAVQIVQTSTGGGDPLDVVLANGQFTGVNATTSGDNIIFSGDGGAQDSIRIGGVASQAFTIGYDAAATTIGGAIVVTAQDGGNNTGGAFTVAAGAGGTDSDGGAITISSGAGNSATATDTSAGGAISVIVGASSEGGGAAPDQAGSDITLTAGDGVHGSAGTGGKGGDIVLNPGARSGVGAFGVVLINGKLTVTGSIDPIDVIFTGVGSAPSTAAGEGAVFVDSGDNLLKYRFESDGAIQIIQTSASGGDDLASVLGVANFTGADATTPGNDIVFSGDGASQDSIQIGGLLAQPFTIGYATNPATGTGGVINITAQTAAAGGDGGSVTLTAGAAEGAGTSGSVVLDVKSVGTPGTVQFQQDGATFATLDEGPFSAGRLSLDVAGTPWLTFDNDASFFSRVVFAASLPSGTTPFFTQEGKATGTGDIWTTQLQNVSDGSASASTGASGAFTAGGAAGAGSGVRTGGSWTFNTGNVGASSSGVNVGGNIRLNLANANADIAGTIQFQQDGTPFATFDPNSSLTLTLTPPSGNAIITMPDIAGAGNALEIQGQTSTGAAAGSVRLRGGAAGGAASSGGSIALLAGGATTTGVDGYVVLEVREDSSTAANQGRIVFRAEGAQFLQIYRDTSAALQAHVQFSQDAIAPTFSQEAATSGAGATLSVIAQKGQGTSSGGDAHLIGGASGSGASGQGGSVDIIGGASVATIGNGGDINIEGGASATGATGNGGSVFIQSGEADSTNGDGGTVNISAEGGAGTGNGGVAVLAAGAGGGGAGSIDGNLILRLSTGGLTASTIQFQEDSTPFMTFDPSASIAVTYTPAAGDVILQSAGDGTDFRFEYTGAAATNGGSFEFRPQAGTGAGDSGNFEIFSAAGGTTGSGGGVGMAAGVSSAQGVQHAAGARMELDGGLHTGSVGGSAEMVSGGVVGIGSGTAGDVTLETGAINATGGTKIAGNIIFSISNTNADSGSEGTIQFQENNITLTIWKETNLVIDEPGFAGIPGIGAGNGQGIVIEGGSADAAGTGQGGGGAVAGGSGGGVSGNGGDATVQGGPAQTASIGGEASVVGGESDTGTAGDALIRSGALQTSGSGGNVIFDIQNVNVSGTDGEVQFKQDDVLFASYIFDHPIFTNPGFIAAPGVGADDGQGLIFIGGTGGTSDADGGQVIVVGGTGGTPDGAGGELSLAGGFGTGGGSPGDIALITVTTEAKVRFTNIAQEVYLTVDGASTLPTQSPSTDATALIGSPLTVGEPFVIAAADASGSDAGSGVSIAAGAAGASSIGAGGSVFVVAGDGSTGGANSTGGSVFIQSGQGAEATSNAGNVIVGAREGGSTSGNDGNVELDLTTGGGGTTGVINFTRDSTPFMTFDPDASLTMTAGVGAGPVNYTQALQTTGGTASATTLRSQGLTSGQIGSKIAGSLNLIAGAGVSSTASGPIQGGGLTMQAGAADGGGVATGATTGGAVIIQGGDASNGVGNENGGAATFRSGTGATADGLVLIQRGTTSVFAGQAGNTIIAAAAADGPILFAHGGTGGTTYLTFDPASGSIDMDIEDGSTLTIGYAAASAGGGGSVNINAQTGATGAGQFTISAGDATTSGGGGVMTISAGDGTAGSGGAVVINGGSSLGGGNPGGPVNITAGDGSLGAPGASLTLTAGRSATGTSGNAILQTKDVQTSGVAGNVILNLSQTNAGTKGIIDFQEDGVSFMSFDPNASVTQSFGATAGPITFTQADSTVSGTAATMTVRAQKQLVSGGVQVGGALVLVGGEGDNGGGGSGTGGAVFLTGGEGICASSGAVGGAVIIKGGAADGPVAGGTGGAVSLLGGDVVQVSGVGGAVLVAGGVNFNTLDSGSVIVRSGNAIGTGDSGTVTVSSGTSVGGDTGAVTIESVAAATAANDSGVVTIRTGNTTNGAAGDINLTTGGGGAGTGSAGDINLSTGDGGSGNGLPGGSVVMDFGTGVSNGGLIFQSDADTFLTIRESLSNVLVEFTHDIADPVLIHISNRQSAGTGEDMIIHAQDISPSGTSTGGDMTVRAGTASQGGTGQRTGGNLFLTGGGVANASTTSGVGGNVNIDAGSATASGVPATGGNVNISSGSAASGSVNTSGNIELNIGNDGSGTPGTIQMQFANTTFMDFNFVDGSAFTVTMGTTTDALRARSIVQEPQPTGNVGSGTFTIQGVDHTGLTLACAAGDLDLLAGEAIGVGGGGSRTGGTVRITAGNAASGASRTAGNVVIRAGEALVSGVQGSIFLNDGAGGTKFRINDVGVGLYGTTPAAQSAAYTRNATIVEDRTLLQSSAATTLNNNNVLAALIADLQSRGFIG